MVGLDRDPKGVADEGPLAVGLMGVVSLGLGTQVLKDERNYHLGAQFLHPADDLQWDPGGVVKGGAGGGFHGLQCRVDTRQLEK